MQLNERAKKYDPDSPLSSLLSWVETVILAVFVIILVFTFVLKIVVVVGRSMENTLFENDKLIISHMFYTPSEGDIVVVDAQSMEEIIIKRVIGVPEDIVEINYDNSMIKVNGKEINESYIKESMTDTGSFDKKFYDEKTKTYTYRVPEGYVFVMGDNRNHSTDSRAIGLIPQDEIVGRVIYRFYSEGAQIGTVD